MAKIQVVSSRRVSYTRTNKKTGEESPGAMLVADLVFSDGQQSFVFEHTWFEGVDRKGVVTEPLPALVDGQVYEFVPRFSKSEFGADKGKLRVAFSVRPLVASVGKGQAA